MSQEDTSQAPEPAADDDLFQFDDLAPQATAASEASTAAGAPTSPPALQPMGLVDDTRADAPAGEPAAEEPLSGRGPLPPLVVPLLLVMAAANLALVGLTWKSLRGPQLPAAAETAAETEDHGHAGAAEHAPQGTHETAGEHHGEGAQRELPGQRQAAWASLDDAERALEAGEFVAARRALYALLTMLDRVDVEERPGIEARAGYVIAESYRRQALSMAESGDAEVAH